MEIPLLDFSALSSEWTKGMLGQIIVEFIRFSKDLDPDEVIAILNANGIHSLDDLKGLENYQSAYLSMATKLHAVDKGQEIFLTVLKSFCEISPSPPVWEAIASDFYGFCMASGMVTQDIKEQVRVIADTELSKVIKTSKYE